MAFSPKPCKCGAPVRSWGQRDCRSCHAAAQKKHRAENPLTQEGRLRMNARSYLNVYVRRGKIKRGPCEICGSAEVQGHQDDPSKPLEVRWLCRADNAKRKAEETNR